MMQQWVGCLAVLVFFFCHATSNEATRKCDSAFCPQILAVSTYERQHNKQFLLSKVNRAQALKVHGNDRNRTGGPV